MEDLFYKGNTQLCGKLKNGTIFPCVTPIPDYLKEAVEKSLSEKKGNVVAKYDKKIFEK